MVKFTQDGERGAVRPRLLLQTLSLMGEGRRGELQRAGPAILPQRQQLRGHQHTVLFHVCSILKLAKWTESEEPQIQKACSKLLNY